MQSEDRCITNFITSVIKKPRTTLEKKEEERCVMIKSLTNTEDIKDFYIDTEECLKRISKIKVTGMNEIEHLKIDLHFEEEFKKGKKLAVFDLDETLVHCEIKKPNKGEYQIQVKIPSGEITNVQFLS
jgi:hypothetical protein